MGVKGPGASTCGFDLFDYSQPYAYLVDVTAEQCEAFQDDEDAFLSLFLAFVDFQVRNLFARAPRRRPRSARCNASFLRALGHPRGPLPCGFELLCLSRNR